MKFYYWDNSKDLHGTLIAEVEAASVMEADKKFEEQTKINPKKSAVSCTVTDHRNTKH